MEPIESEHHNRVGDAIAGVRRLPPCIFRSLFGGGSMPRRLVEVLLTLAGVCFLLAVLIRFNILSVAMLNIAPHTFLNVTEILLVAAVALAVYGLLPAPAKVEKKD